MERSKHLHNFNLPPGLTWGKQKILRCMNISPLRPMPAVDDNHDEKFGLKLNFQSVSKDVSGYEDRISTTREKLMMECQKDVEKMRQSIFKKKLLNSKSLQKFASKSSPSASSPPLNERSEKKRPRRNVEKKEERPKFSIGLSWKEIEEDFIAMTGKKPPRKPKKQPKRVRMMLDDVFPGSQLHKVRLDRYKVNGIGKN